MSKKAFVPLRIAELQRVIAEPITDPAEQAALDKVRQREKKSSGPLMIAPLQRVIAEPITDPAELAAVDKLRKRLKRKQGEQKKDRNGKKTGTLAKKRG